MKNKIELKKAVKRSCFSIIIISIIFGLVLICQYKAYTGNFNKKIEMIMVNVKNQYPDIDENALMNVINSENDEKADFLKQYGINLEKDSILIKNDKLFIKFLITNLCILIGLSTIVIIVFLKYNNHKDKKIQEITNYIEEINNKNYKLDIEDNTEDELSILKNEIYKTTVMLKEVAENSVKDKIKLKDSLSNISHQLKTPLTSMSILVDNIMDNPEMDSETRNDFIKDIRREIININFLVNALLKLSKLDANSIRFINRDVCIDEILQAAIKNVSVLCDLKDIDIITYGDKDIKINCDVKWQVEAVTNILKNCVEHSYDNSKIEISFEENKVYTKIEIRDYGVGIDKCELRHIFERFYKGKNSSSDSVGIGLALTKSIIEANNGIIYVESEIGKGSLFVVKYFR